MEGLQFLIIPGFARTGTTALFDALAAARMDFSPSSFKEIDYLSSRHSISDYLNYFESGESGRIFLDASPQYSEADHFIANAKIALEGARTLFLVTARNPLSRLYSHYMHDLRKHFWRFTFTDYRLYNPSVLTRYLRPHSSFVRGLVAAFGKENVLLSDMSDPRTVIAERIATFFNLTTLPIIPERIETEIAVGWIPRIFYDERNYSIVNVGANLYLLPPRTLLVLNGESSELEFDFPAEIANAMVRNSANWTREFDPKQLDDGADSLVSDYRDAFAVMGKPRDPRPVELLKAAEPPSFPTSMGDRLEFLGSIADAVKSKVGETTSKATHLGDGSARLTTRGLPPSFLECLDWLQKAYLSGSVAERIYWIEQVFEVSGPVPDLVQTYISELLAAGEGQKAIRFIRAKPFLRRFIQLPNMLQTLRHHECRLPVNDVKDLRTILMSP